MSMAGALNLITDVPGLLVGQAEDFDAMSGTTVVLAEAPAIAAVDVRGGAPGSRETELLDPATLVSRVDAIVLSGGSAFGLDAAAGVMDGLAAMERGFAVRNTGAGLGAKAGRLKAGLGSTSLQLGDGSMVGAIVAVNSWGSVVRPD